MLRFVFAGSVGVSGQKFIQPPLIPGPAEFTQQFGAHFRAHFRSALFPAFYQTFRPAFYQTFRPALCPAFLLFLFFPLVGAPADGIG